MYLENHAADFALESTLLWTRLPPPSRFQQECAHQPRSDCDASHDCSAYETFLGNLVVDETLQASGLQICWLKFEQQLVVPPGLRIVAEFVVSEGEVVETLAATFTRPPEDVGQEAHAFLLVGTLVGLDQTLRGVS
jgi:hypothetical protein